MSEGTYEVGYYGIPGIGNGYGKIHIILDGWPVCGTRIYSELKQVADFTSVTCSKCKKLAQNREKRLETKEA